MEEQKNNIGVPKTLAIIMDGNGRWALRRGLAREAGHKAGAKATENIVFYALSRGIKDLILYTFSSENWSRPKAEVNSIMTILREYLSRNVNTLIDYRIKIKTIGNLNALSNDIVLKLAQIQKKTEACEKMTVSLALSYGGQEEIVSATKNLCQKVLEKKLCIKDISRDLLQEQLWTSKLPSPDLLIRTSGEKRLSNFLLWQLSYSELYFTRTLWPDFSPADLDNAISCYQKRLRRFGKTQNG